MLSFLCGALDGAPPFQEPIAFFSRERLDSLQYVQNKKLKESELELLWYWQKRTPAYKTQSRNKERVKEKIHIAMETVIALEEDSFLMVVEVKAR